MSSSDHTAELLRASQLFTHLPPATNELVRERLTEMTIDSGEWLMRKGDPADALYIVDAGRLEVVLGEQEGVAPEDDSQLRVLRVLGRGATVGELALVTGDPRSASVRASRDSSLLRLSYEDFNNLIDAEPAFARALASALGRQLQVSGGFPEDAPQNKTLTIVPLVEGMNSDVIAEAVVAAFDPRDDVALLGRDTAESGDAVEWGRQLDELEQRHDRVVLVSQHTNSAWRRFCVRQADRLVCLAPPQRPPDERTMPRLRGCDLVLLGEDHPASIANMWIDRLRPRARHRVRAGANRNADLGRLARRLTGTSLGLVLGGGGARGLAHLGVLEVLEENGIVVDRVGGTSMGGIVASTFAYQLSAADRRRAVKSFFAPRVRHRYQMPPRSAVAKVEVALETMRGVFGDQQIETLPVDLFTIAADLVAAEMVVQRRGSVAEAAMSTARIPAILPPGRSSGRLLVDGGLIRNLPVDVMADMDEGPVIAIEVGGRFEPPTDEDGHPSLPALGETLMRSVMLGSAAAGSRVTSRAELLLEPSVSSLKMLAFGEIDKGVAIGRSEATEHLDEIRALVAR
ncbi:MAG: patatin-like phospholipase domain-containing protein [Solirubrobacteraceae bacterium]|jgi:NTE family protein|nr:patatin-like phospholipase domain-containing protein [Solirubrobacteraceae bacterium]MDP4673623.1 patatin-like phospholipase domain-containing protein [Solirubrobacteraceae bacterium]MDP4920728.1 patatin-like phospholipase domain-containing protein [Solirubrobacteraceae bacterium]